MKVGGLIGIKAIKDLHKGFESSTEDFLKIRGGGWDGTLGLGCKRARGGNQCKSTRGKENEVRSERYAT